MVTIDKKILNDRQRARKVYGSIRRVPDIVTYALSDAESEAAVLKLDWKESVRVASTTNISLLPGTVTAIDGVTLSADDRILLKDQSTAAENGIYVYAGSSPDTWTRTTDAVPGTTLTCGATTYVEDGTINEGSKWTLSTKNPISAGTNKVWELFNYWLTSGSQMKTSLPVSIGDDYPENIGKDIFFYVSGSKMSGGPALSETNISVFGGDVLISGSLDLVRGEGLFGNFLEISGSLAVTTGSIYAQDADTGDYTFFVSSSSGNTGIKGNLEVTGSITANTGLSGSLTKLSDGTSYLIAGTNITITSSSNGPVIISSTGGGGGGSPAGGSEEIQFNTGGSFDASANLKFSPSNVLKVTGSVSVMGPVLPSVDSTYDLGSSALRWANVYTGDLHLKNERGDWTLIEESDYITIRNNKTHQIFKLLVEPITIND